LWLHDRVPDYKNHPAYREALGTRAFGLGLPEREKKPPEHPATDLSAVRVPLARECAKLQRTLRRLLEDRDPPDADPSNPSAPPSDDPRLIVQRVLPDSARESLLPVLCNIAGSSPEALEDQQSPTGQPPLLTTLPLDRSSSESRLTDLACDRRAANLLDVNPELSRHVDDVGKALAEWLAGLFDTAHQVAVEAFGEGDAGRIARRYYQCFDYFDCVQFPMMFGTDIGEPDIIDIVRICPEDAPSLVPEAAERRAKLKGLAVAHFGAFLDRDWRVSDLLWGRLDAAERIITALLPLQESAKLRDHLISEAHAAILAEFDARTLLGRMAINLARNQGSRHPRFLQTVQPVINAIARAAAAANRLLGKVGINLARNEGSRRPPTQQIVERVIDAIAPATPPNRANQTAFMSLWRMLVPAEPDRVMLMRSLARGTTITGRMLDGIAGGTQLSVPARWLTRFGRTFWGLVEISVPRHWVTLLGRYWQSLLLLISLSLILAGLLTARAAVSGFGWAVLAFAVLLIVVRTTLWDFMRAGRVRVALVWLAILIVAGVLVFGGWQICQRVSGKWGELQAWTCGVLDNCPTQPTVSEPRPRSQCSLKGPFMELSPFSTMLSQPPADSPQAAVRAITAEEKQR